MMAGENRNLLKALVWSPVDIASLAIYRMVFGFLMFWGLARFCWNGWVERSFIEPNFFFKYWGFQWVIVPEPAIVYLIFSMGIIASIGVILGAFYRVSAILLFFSFSYIELMDQSNYLNHYYLLSLLAFLNIFIPLNGKWSLDVKIGAAQERDFVPAWNLNLIRFQIASVYFFAGMAKIGSDWLFHAQPLNLWMMPKVDLPLIGALLSQSWVHYLMAWAGLFFDSLIWLFLLIPASRIPAYIVLLSFHFFTGVFFPIGLFPFIMCGCATILFSPSWPRRILRQMGILFGKKVTNPLARGQFSSSPLVLSFLGLWISFHLLMPVRHFLYSSDLLWSEEGMRFSWRVMAREKTGDVTFRVMDKNSQKRWEISPSQYLMRHQIMEMSNQPDMILQLAHHIRSDFKKKNIDVIVNVDAFVSLNGRKPSRFIDPLVDLSREPYDLKQKSWILPGPEEEPTMLSRVGGNP